MILAAAAHGFDVVPYLPFAGVVIGGLIVGGFAVWNRRRGAAEARLPSVTDLWARADKLDAEVEVEREVRRRAQTWLDVLRPLVRRLLSALGAEAPTLTAEEHQALNGHLNPTVPKEDT